MDKASSPRVDMTKGPILRQATRFALPVCAGHILNLLYTTVDTLVISNFCDSAAVAGVATSSQPMEITLCLFMGMGSGVSILVSQAVGRKDEAELRELARTAVWILFVCALPLTALGVFMGPVILRWMHVPADAMPDAVTYLGITMLGILGNMGYNFNAGILRGLGNSKASLYMLAVSCVVNIILDLLLTGVLGLGVMGVAAATVTALFLSWFFSILYLRRRYSFLQLPLFPKGTERRLLREVLRLGLPLGFNTSLYSMGHTFLQAIYNEQGTIFVAGCSLAGKIGGLASIAIQGFSQAASVFSGQNLGVGDYRRLRKGACIPFFSGFVTLCGGVVISVFCPTFLKIFNPEPEVLVFAVRYLRVILPFQWCYATFSGIISLINGLGETRYTTVVNVILLWGVRIPSAYLLAYLGYGEYAMAGVSISFVVGLAAMLLYFRTRKWAAIREKAELQTENAH